MATTRDIRRRIKSVKNTAQITKAMQMVAAAKMRKAQQAALGGRPYARLMNQVLAAVTSGATDFAHPLLEVVEVRRAREIRFDGFDRLDFARAEQGQQFRRAIIRQVHHISPNTAGTR